MLGGHVFGGVVSAELWFASDFVLAHLVCTSSQSSIAFVVLGMTLDFSSPERLVPHCRSYDS